MTEAIKKSSHHKILSPEVLATKEAAKIAKKVARAEASALKAQVKKQAKQEARNSPEAIEARKQRKTERDKDSKARRQSNPKPRRIITPEELALKAQAQAQALKARAKALKALKTKPTTEAQTPNRKRPTVPMQKIRVYYIKAYKYAGEVIEKLQSKASVIDRSAELKALEAARQEARRNSEAFISGRVLDYRQANHFAKVYN